MTRTGIRASAIIIRDNMLLLVHRKQDGEEYWVFPGGGIEEGETAEDAVIREVKEETGLNITTSKLIFTDQTFTGGNTHPFFLCEVAEGEPVWQEKEKITKSELYELEWVNAQRVSKINIVPVTAKHKVIALLNKQPSEKIESTIS